MLVVEANTPSPLYPQLITGKYDQIRVEMPKLDLITILVTFSIYIYIYIYTYEYRVSGHVYEFRVSGQFISWIYINKINITLHFFTHVETVGVGYINNYFFIFSL